MLSENVEKNCVYGHTFFCCTNIKVNISTPCIGVCQYNEEEFCAGCFRSSKEISEWATMSKEEKLKVIEILPSRMEDLF